MRNVTPTQISEAEIVGGIAVMTESRTALLSRPTPDLGLDPDWDKARQLYAVGQRAVRDLAAEIKRLRDSYLQPAGMRRGSVSQNVKQKNEGGFVAKLQSELGLHPQQADRIIESADYQVRIQAAAQALIGDRITWMDKDKPCSLEVTEEIQEFARQAVAEWALPFPPKPSRQWAGLRSVGKTKGMDRAPVDSAKQVRNALRSLEVHLPKWAKFSPEEQAVLAGIAKQIGLESMLVPLLHAAERSTVETKR